jgi:hypothetical protein
MDQHPTNQAATSSKTGLWVALSIFLTALLVGGGVYAWQQSQREATENDLQDQIDSLEMEVDELSEEASTEQEATSDTGNNDVPTTFKTYTDAEFGLAMNIPKDCRVEEFGEHVEFDCALFDPQIFKLIFADSENSRPTEGVSVADWMSTRVLDVNATTSISTNYLDMVVEYSDSCPQTYDSDEYYFINESQLFQLHFIHPSCDAGKKAFSTEQAEVIYYIVSSISFE